DRLLAWRGLRGSADFRQGPVFYQNQRCIAGDPIGLSALKRTVIDTFLQNNGISYLRPEILAKALATHFTAEEIYTWSQSNTDLEEVVWRFVVEESRA